MKNDDIEMMDLGFIKDAIQETDTDIIAFKKYMSRIRAESFKKSKLDTCYYCHKPTSGFCNSHFVPAFCLRNIAVNGEVFYSNTLINLPILDIDKGVNEAGTFRLICRDCDSKIFSDYENPNNYDYEPSPKIIAQIAMKNYMAMISKRFLKTHIMIILVI